MKNDDAQFIQRVLDGDDTAFSALVRKYQRSVHALAWRKVEDFHIAEDITQDTFLKAYQRLSTLKEPQSFASWLYVITANQCKAWLRKKRTWVQSLEDTNSAQLEKATYSGHIIEENERMSVETQREVVKKLLAKLQESDRTVITLYYLGGMTYEEISKFSGCIGGDDSESSLPCTSPFKEGGTDDSRSFRAISKSHQTLQTTSCVRFRV